MYTLVKRGQTGAQWEKPEDMPQILHALLCSRGIASAEEAQIFLHPQDQPLHDPLTFPGVKEAVRIIREAIAQKNKVCVYGDYDVDGVSASTILSGALETLGADVCVRIPLRADEGYGLNENAVRELSEAGVDLLITVDCGISDRKNTDLAMELGMQVIVTDHHRASEESLPRCTVVSSQMGEYPCPVLCGAGVAFKLACALDERFAAEYIDIAALATVADIVPLVDENRTIVAKGLRRMNEGLRPGLLALLREAGMEKRRVTEETLGFQIGPRLNAGGRLGSAERSYKLLRAKTQEEAEELAKELNAENNARRTLEREVARQAHEQLAGYDFTRRRAIALKGTQWNSGVIGIAASRLVEEYHYPVLLFAEQDGVLKGSCRSIEGVDIYLALKACEKHLTKYGGHTAAAGLTLDADKFEAFCDDLDRYLSENIAPEVYIPSHVYDAEAPVREVDAAACLALEMMRPFGMGNPAPMFLAEFMPAGVRRIGAEGNHLKLTMTDEFDSRLDAVWFGHGDAADALVSGTRRMAIGTLQANEFQNVIRPQFMMNRLLPESAGALFARAKEGYVPQSFLTEILYTEKKQNQAEMISLQEAAGLLAENVQGLVFAAAGVESAQELREAFVSCGAALLPDIAFGEWTQDERCFSCIAVCPHGDPPAGVKAVVALDLEPEYFGCRDDIDVYMLPAVAVMPEWLGLLPDIDMLRETYIAARRVGSRPLRVKDESALIAEIAREADQTQLTAAAGLIALCDMGLVQIKDDPPGVETPRGVKMDPAENRIFKRITQLRERSRLL